MNKILAIANNKGGVGKSTTAANVGCILSKFKNVLMVDLDAQANLTSHLLNEKPEISIFHAMTGEKTLPIIHHKNYDIIPASLELSWADMKLGGVFQRELLLTKLLEPIKNNYDYIILDCPPSLGLITQNAFMAATDIIIPLQADVFSLEGLKMIIDFYNAIKAGNNRLNLLGIVVNRWKKNTMYAGIDEQLMTYYQKYMFKTHIRENIEIVKSNAYHQSIIEYNPKCAASLDYMELVNEIISRINI